MVSLAIPMRVNAGDSIPISQKERKAPKDCGCKEREGIEKCRGKKVFKKILGMGEWAPLFFGAFQPYPPLDIPQGVSRGASMAWAWLIRGLMVRAQGTGRATGQAQGIGSGYQYPNAYSYGFNILKSAYIFQVARAISFQAFQVI